MSIVRLTDAEVRERIMKPTDDRQLLWDLAIEITNQRCYTAGVYSIEDGVRVLVTNLSGKVVIDADCKLPQDDDDPFTVSSKRRFIRTIMTQMRKLIRDEPKGAA